MTPHSNSALPNQHAWENVWHLWHVRIPRRGLNGKFVWGLVLRRRYGDRWIYRELERINDKIMFRRS